jgi:serine O-acetyltransferase
MLPARHPMPTLRLVNTTGDTLCGYVARQLDNVFPDGAGITAKAFDPYMEQTLERLRVCFSGIKRRKYQDDAGPFFNYMHPDHHAVFLYLLANTIHRSGGASDLAFRVYYLNKALHALDAFYDAQLPEIFMFMHPLGTVLGHARYGNYFCAYQNCTVGSDEPGNTPEFSEGVVMYAGATVIGRSKIGANVVFGANAFVIDRDIPDNSIVMGAHPRLRVMPNHKHVLDRRFR